MTTPPTLDVKVGQQCLLLYLGHVLREVERQQQPVILQRTLRTGDDLEIWTLGRMLPRGSSLR
jgi:hypothetical protein